jgi:hypothetical protein
LEEIGEMTLPQMNLHIEEGTKQKQREAASLAQFVILAYADNKAFDELLKKLYK